MRRYSVLLFLTIFGVLLAQAAPVEAAVRGTLKFRLSCTGFTSRGGSLPLNRDNTGNNQEAYSFTAYDGNGNVIYNETSRFVVGGRLNYPAGEFRLWSSTPQANPLVLKVTSLAGNGKSEEVVLRWTEQCPTLTASGTELATVSGLQAPLDLEEITGGTAPALPLNATAPTPITINNINTVFGLSGYGIVNTSRLNMRTGDGVQYAPVAILNGGTELVILGRNANDSWWYVQADNVVGWVNTEFLLLRGDLRATPQIPVDGEIRPPRFVVYSTSTLYQAPDAFTTPVCEIAGNLEYAVIGRDEESNWYQLEATCDGNAVTGWIAADRGALRDPAQRFIPQTN
jgi:hypothetical protein